MTDSKRMGSVVKRTAAVSSGIQVSSMVIDLAVMAVMARLLTPADYGIFAAALLFMAVCDLLREIGVSSTIIQLPNLSVADQRTSLTLVMITGSVAFAVSLLTAGLFADFMDIPELETVVKVMALTLLIQVFGNISQGLLLRRMEAVKVSVAEAGARALASVLIGITLALAGAGYWALVIASVADAFMRTVMLVWMAKPPLRPAFHRDSAQRVLSTGSGFALSRILAFVSTKTDMAVVGKFLDASSLGIYSRASKLMQLPTNLYGKVADRVVFPAMTRVQNEPHRLKSAFLRGTELTALLGLSLAVCGFVLAPEVIAVLMGEQWGAVVPIFSIFSISMYFRLAGRVSGSVLRATASMRALVLAHFVNAALVLILSLAVAKEGTQAVAWAVTGSLIIWFLMMSFSACRRAGVSLSEFVAAHRYGVLMAAFTGAICMLVTSVCRQAELPGLIVLIATGLALGLFGCLLVAMVPRWCLGDDARGILLKIRNMISTKLQRPR